MPWTYSQRTGVLTHDGIYIGKGYSGSPAGKNNPAMEQVKNVGPIPRGKYQIDRPWNSARHGPHVMNLVSIGHTTFGRTGFLIHGERRTGLLGRASQGCIILSPAIRHWISASTDHELIVTQ